MKIQLRKKWQNTIGHDKVQPVQLVTAEEFNDLPVIIKTASEEKFKVRCAGSGHSFNDIACTHGYLVSIDKLNKIIARTACLAWEVAAEGAGRAVA